jgi:hypothetical protein
MPAFETSSKQQKLWFCNFEVLASFMELSSKKRNGLGIFFNILALEGVYDLSQTEETLDQLSVFHYLFLQHCYSSFPRVIWFHLNF